MTLDSNWFSEKCGKNFSAFSFEITEHLHSEKTAYQQIDIYHTKGFGNLMVIDGFVMLTQRDNFIYHEMMSHPVLYLHPNPESVVIIGCGDCGTLREVLKHPEVQQVTQIEIDEQVTQLAEIHFPELCQSNNDPRATLAFIDGIQWIADQPDGTIDIIIVDSTDPVGPAEGLFNQSFYADCFRALKTDGLLIQQSESPFYHLDILKAMHRAMQAAGFGSTHLLNYFQCSYPSGWWSSTIACKQSKLPKLRKNESDQRPFTTRYFNTEMVQAAMTLPQDVKIELSNL